MTLIEKMAIHHVISTLNATRNMSIHNNMQQTLDKVDGISNDIKKAILMDNNNAIDKSFNLPIMECVRWLESLLESK